jgi:hypothetical protein
MISRVEDEIIDELQTQGFSYQMIYEKFIINTRTSVPLDTDPIQLNQVKFTGSPDCSKI